MIANRKSNYYLRLFLDLLILNLAFIVAAILAQSLHTLMARNYMFVLLAILNFLWYFTSNINGFYDDSISRSFSSQFNNILKNTFVQIVAAVLFIFITKEDLFTRNFILIYAFLLIAAVSLRIHALNFLLRKVILKGTRLQNVVIVGSGEVARNFCNSTIKQQAEYNFVGYLDDVDNKSDNSEIIGRIDDLEKVITTKNIDEVIVALTISDYERLENIIKICNRHAVRVYIIPDYFRFVSKRYRVSMFENFPIITVRDEPLAEFHWRFVKRSFDILFSLTVIVLFLSWLIPILAGFIKIFSRGPVFFTQKRIGMKNKTFNFYKLRTMTAEPNQKKETYLPVVEGDERITRIGKILRKTNLDELPQFFNILKGDMSVVGPRPHFIPYNEVYSEIVDEIKLRSRVRPGLTGWAQIHGLRGDSPDPIENEIRTKRRIEYDIWYIENWSIWLDFQIILITIWQMIRGKTRAV